MGNASKKGPVPVKQQLLSVRDRSESRLGKAPVTGRYHLLPRKIKDDYIVEDTVLGTGLNGEVFKGRSKTDGLEVAIKPYTSVGINKEEQRSLRNEVEIFLSMDHPHVARLLDVYEEVDRLLLVMEMCKGGEIYEYIQKQGSFNEKKAADLVYQMLLAVNYLHSRHIVHRDLKPENFLFETKAFQYVKLIDFGMSRFWTNNRKMKLACGTVSYVAPECLEESYDLKCDLWSMGVISYLLLCGKLPFNGSESQQIDAIRAANYSMDGSIWAGVSETGRDFVRKLMTKDPEQRLSAEEALQHPWIAEREKLRAEAAPVDAGMVSALKKFSQASSLRRVCFSMMAYSMTLEERRAVREAFMAIDTQNTGRITLAEMKSVLSKHIADEDAKDVFAALDTNHDEHICYTDFLAAMMTSRIAQNEMHIRSAFNRLDRDNSGYITLGNLKEVLGSSHNGEDIEKLMREADFAGDGRISYEEFMQYMQGETAPEHHQEALMKVVEQEKKNKGTGGGLQSVEEGNEKSPTSASKEQKPQGGEQGSCVCAIL